MSAARHVSATADPVAAVLDAHDRGEPIALRTSGTTSEPRAVVRTTRSWVDSFPHVSVLTGIDQHSRGWVPGPRHLRPVFAPALVAFVGGSGWRLTVSTGGRTANVGTPAVGLYLWVSAEIAAGGISRTAATIAMRIAQY